ncbi:NRDE family protein [Glaciecola sp. MH2013]|uniref:NRDE family protein n=1 Tax=Glaciecola sp. MH2013 TaxID=2785524 RepID=UPI00189F9514|nr:NRDE family protein [Glaciecola sp. MH2013]MBF7072762.1 NRDE family protein [Glaciecola sp. MH2013]
MCILFIAVNQHPKYPLIVAANRDEFHKRPTSNSQFWTDKPDILAGKDEEAGGTWMGINRDGAISALTNIRAPGREVNNATTRGELVMNFLDAGKKQRPHYAEKLSSTREHYNGYNLLFGHLEQLYVYNNFDDELIALNDGVYGLSNASLNSPWPKIAKGRDALAKYCKHANMLDTEHLFELLKNDALADDDALPKTGVPLEWERRLSSIFIQTDDYGTRSSTLLLVDKNNHVTWEERSFDNQAKQQSVQKYAFDLHVKD